MTGRYHTGRKAAQVAQSIADGDKALRLLRGGVDRAVIAERLGRSVNTVNAIIRQARAREAVSQARASSNG